MRQLYVLLLALFFLSCTSSRKIFSINDLRGDILIQNINIVDVENNRVVEAQDVLIRDKRIIEISKHRIRNSNATVVMDGKGKFLIPGLWDMHSHPLSERDLLLMLIHGVTGTRIMDGDTNTLKWREQVQKGELRDP